MIWYDMIYDLWRDRTGYEDRMNSQSPGYIIGLYFLTLGMPMPLSPLWSYHSPSRLWIDVSLFWTSADLCDRPWNTAAALSGDSSEALSQRMTQLLPNPPAFGGSHHVIEMQAAWQGHQPEGPAEVPVTASIPHLTWMWGTLVHNSSTSPWCRHTERSNSEAI